MKAYRMLLHTVALIRTHACDHWMKGGQNLPEDYILALPVLFRQLSQREPAITGSIVNAGQIVNECMQRFGEHEQRAAMHFQLLKDFYADIFAPKADLTK